MKIFIISRGYPSKKDPQWGCFEKDQAEALVAMGHQVVMISYDTRFRFYWRKLGIDYKASNGVVSYSIYMIPDNIIKLLFGYRINSRFSDLLINKVYQAAVKKFGKPDILYSHYLDRTRAALSLKRKYDIPLVALEHWSEVNKDKLKNYVRIMGEDTYKHVDFQLSVSESLRKRIYDHFHVDSKVIHNMYGKEFFYSDNELHEGDYLQYVSTASLLHLKGFDLLIEAFAKSGISKQNWRLVIIGEGPERHNLEKQIRVKGLDNNIFLVGRKQRYEVVKILQQSNVFVLPSRTENFSVAVLEGLACGLPVIASICGGIRECINEKNGLLFPVEDVKSLSLCLQRMQENYSKYNRKAIADNCHTSFSPETIAKQLTVLFEDVLNKKKRRY